MTTIINGSSPSITFSDSTTQTTAGLTGSSSQLCQSWICFKGDTSPTIRASYNVSSVSYVSTGVFNVNFTTPMVDTNYAVVTTGFIDNTGSYGRYVAREINGTISTSYYQIRTDTTIGLYNGVDYIGVAVFR
jgi:hypothetical protein